MHSIGHVSRMFKMISPPKKDERHCTKVRTSFLISSIGWQGSVTLPRPTRADPARRERLPGRDPSSHPISSGPDPPSGDGDAHLHAHAKKWSATEWMAQSQAKSISFLHFYPKIHPQRSPTKASTCIKIVGILHSPLLCALRGLNLS